MSDQEPSPEVAAAEPPAGAEAAAATPEGALVPPSSSAAPSLPPPSKLPSLRPSGIKPPSKIGRLCDGQAKAAPLPPTPTQSEYWIFIN